jgi:hypothetical protein
MDCCICLEQIQSYNRKTLNCKHQFHYKCIMDYIISIQPNYNNLFYIHFNCPLCRNQQIIIQRSHSKV